MKPAPGATAQRGVTSGDSQSHAKLRQPVILQRPPKCPVRVERLVRKRLLLHTSTTRQPAAQLRRGLRIPPTHGKVLQQTRRVLFFAKNEESSVQSYFAR